MKKFSIRDRLNPNIPHGLVEHSNGYVLVYTGTYDDKLVEAWSRASQGLMNACKTVCKFVPKEVVVDGVPVRMEFYVPTNLSTQYVSTLVEVEAMSVAKAHVKLTPKDYPPQGWRVL